VTARELELAESEVRRRSAQVLHAIALACAAAMGALGFAWWSTPVAIALGVGASTEAVVAAVLVQSRRDRLERLALEPAAYAISDVKRYGRRCVRQRERLAASLARMVADARVPGSLYLSDRVLQFRLDLEALSRALASSAANVHPTSAVACRRLLTRPVESPLYNPRLGSDELRAALRRIGQGIEAN